MPTDIRTALLEIIERSIELVKYHAIWYELVHPDNQLQYETILKDYEEFFKSTAHAHFQAIAVTVYQLFENRKKKDTKSFPYLIDLLEPKDHVFTEKLREMIEANKSVLGKLFSIRNKVYAHRNATSCPKDIFIKAQVSPGTMTTILALVEQILSLLTEKVGIESGFNMRILLLQKADRARADLIRIIRTLQETPSNKGIQADAAEPWPGDAHVEPPKQ